MTLGERITARREALGLRQVDLADMANVTGSAMNQIEHSRTIPNAYTFAAIAQALGMSMEELLSGGEDERKKAQM